MDLCAPLKDPVNVAYSNENVLGVSSVYSDVNQSIIQLEEFHGRLDDIYYGYDINPDGWNVSSTFFDDNRSFWYPYDGFKRDITSHVEYTLYKGNNEYASQSASVQFRMKEFETADWDVSVAIVDRTRIHLDYIRAYIADSGSSVQFNNQNYDRLIISFNRPLIYQIAYPVVLIAMLAFIILLTRINSLETFLEGSLAILFGIFNIKSVLFPYQTNTRTIIDLFVLILLLSFAIVILWFFVRSEFIKDTQSKDKEIVVDRINSSTQLADKQEVWSAKTRHVENSQVLVWLLITFGINSIIKWILQRKKSK